MYDLSTEDTFFFISRQCKTFNRFLRFCNYVKQLARVHGGSLSALWIHLQTWTDHFLLIRLRPKGWERWRDIFITSSGGLAWTNENVNLCFDICLIGLSLLCVHWNQTKRLIQIIRITGPCLVDIFRHGNCDLHRQMGAHSSTITFYCSVIVCWLGTFTYPLNQDAQTCLYWRTAGICNCFASNWSKWLTSDLNILTRVCHMWGAGFRYHSHSGLGRNPSGLSCGMLELTSAEPVDFIMSWDLLSFLVPRINSYNASLC